MPVSLTPDQAAAALRALGHAPEHVVPLSGGLWSAAFAYRDRGREYVVRFHERRDDLDKDRFAERWRGGALRIPHMVEIGESAHGPYGIAERVHGAPIDDRDEHGMREILPALFAALDALREADVAGTRGYGLWHGDGNGPHATWRDALVREDAPGERADQRRSLTRAHIGVTEFNAGLGRMHELLPFCPEDRYAVHNDVLNYNVFADAEGVVLLDWGASIYGDFLYDFALLTFWWPWYQTRWGGIDVRAELERHYRDIGLVVPGFRERLRCCELDVGIGHIAWQASRGEWDRARWTAARTLELVNAPL